VPADPFLSSRSARLRTRDVRIRTGIVTPPVNTVLEKGRDRSAAEVSTSFHPRSFKEWTGSAISATNVIRLYPPKSKELVKRPFYRGKALFYALWFFPPLPTHGRSQRFKSFIAHHFVINGLRQSAASQNEECAQSKPIHIDNDRKPDLLTNRAERTLILRPQLLNEIRFDPVRSPVARTPGNIEEIVAVMRHIGALGGSRAAYDII